MHPRHTTLLAFCDAEGGAGRTRRIAGHVAKCEKCRRAVEQIRSERAELLARAAVPAIDGGQGLAGVMAAITAWQEGRTGAAASELRARLRSQLETYFGTPAALAAQRPELRAEEMFNRASEMLEVFLGPEAAEAVRDDVFRGLDWAAPAGETCQ
jgi:hypothetical protein